MIHHGHFPLGKFPDILNIIRYKIFELLYVRILQNIEFIKLKIKKFNFYFFYDLKLQNFK